MALSFIVTTAISTRSLLSIRRSFSCSQPTQTLHNYNYNHNHSSRLSYISSRSTPRATTPSSSSSVTQLREGDVVAVQRSATSTRPELYIVAGCSSNGSTVDLQALDEYVSEMYIPSTSKPISYERASAVRLIPAEYVPSQRGWIVLDADVAVAKSYFDSYYTIASSNEEVTVTVDVEKQVKTPLTYEQRKRAVFTLTKSQAFIAAAFSLPVAAAFYAAFVALRDSVYNYDAGASGGQRGTLAMAVVFGASVSSLVVGCGLFMYAVNKKEATEKEEDGVSENK